MSIIEKKEKNLIQLIDKLDSLSLSYSQPKYEIEKIRSEKNELSRQKTEIEKKIDTFSYSAIEWRALNYIELNKEQSEKILGN